MRATEFLDDDEGKEREGEGVVDSTTRKSKRTSRGRNRARKAICAVRHRLKS